MQIVRQTSATRVPTPFKVSCIDNSPLVDRQADRTSDSSIGGGLIALGFLGLVSILSTVGLIVFIVYRIVFWRGHYRSSIATNQYILLILSLLCADLIQALSFVCSFFWYSHEPIGSNRHWCTTQGVMIHLGDVASAFFVLAIALHTWYQVGMGRKLDDHTFVGILVFIWGFSVILTVIAPAMHGTEVYTASGAWVSHRKYFVVGSILRFLTVLD